MFIKDLRSWVDAKPFEPFAMHLTSGERVVVRHPENCYFGKNSIFVAHARDRDLQGFSNVSLYHIAKIEPANGHAGNGNGKKTKRSR
jgi:hypothetical protein